jgi:hypothetical protein
VDRETPLTLGWRGHLCCGLLFLMGVFHSLGTSQGPGPVSQDVQPHVTSKRGRPYQTGMTPVAHKVCSESKPVHLPPVLQAEGVVCRCSAECLVYIKLT